MLAHTEDRQASALNKSAHRSDVKQTCYTQKPGDAPKTTSGAQSPPAGCRKLLALREKLLAVHGCKSERTSDFHQAAMSTTLPHHMSQQLENALLEGAWSHNSPSMVHE